MMNCKQATELVSQKLDRKLGLAQRLSLKMHLLMCHLCRKYARQLEFLHRATPQIDDHIENQSDIELSDAAKTKIKQALDEQP